MTLPGITVTSRESQAASSIEVETGTGFMVGLAERGPTDRAVLVRNLDQYEETFGGRVTNYTTMYDCVDTFFREGGSRLYISRIVGPSPTVATVNIPDGGATNTLRADAVNAGAWGADIDLEVETSGVTAGSFVLIVRDDNTEVERSPELVDKAAAIAWAADSDYIRLTDLGAGSDPADGTYNLAGGTDDRSNATDATRLAALNRFTKDLGAGQVAAPGYTTATAHSQLLDHAEANHRVAILDYADTANESTLIAAIATDRALSNADFGAAFGPWAEIPGVAGGTVRTVPYSAIQMGIIARSDSMGNSPNVAAAGDNGVSVYAVGLSQDAWTDAEREQLNDGGLNVARVLDGAVRTYGYRTIADPTTDNAFIQFSARREFMSLAARGSRVLERFMFSQLDGKRTKLGQMAGELIGICLDDYNAGALYGSTPEEAFSVNTGEQVNPESQLAQGIVKAVIAAKVSPFAERVELELVKVANTEALT
jgi:uncharacterized protein